MGTGTGRMDWRMKRRSAVCPVIDGLDTLRAAAERMWRQQTGGLVLPERGRLAGIITERCGDRRELGSARLHRQPSLSAQVICSPSPARPPT
jgi:hypothetical protein